MRETNSHRGRRSTLTATSSSPINIQETVNLHQKIYAVHTTVSITLPLSLSVTMPQGFEHSTHNSSMTN